MKRQKMLFKVAVLCVCMLSLWGVMPVKGYAQETVMDIEPRMTYISSYSTDLVISSSGVATVTGVVRGITGVTSTYVKVTLQKNVLGFWIEVESWEKSNDGKVTAISETYDVSKGTYRVVMTCSANTETRTATSASRTY